MMVLDMVIKQTNGLPTREGIFSDSQVGREDMAR
jgi:hypothetical protein